MPVLKNHRWEKFARELAKGKSAIEAYEIAGFKPHRSSASKLQHAANISQRVSELLQQERQKDARAVEIAAQKLAITKEAVLSELAKIGFANMADYMRAGPNGDPYLDFSNLTRDQTAALAEVTVEDFKDGRGDNARDVRRIKFKLHDKKSALVDIGRELGMFVNRTEVGAPGDFARMTDEELDAFIAERAGIDSGGDR